MKVVRNIVMTLSMHPEARGEIVDGFLRCPDCGEVWLSPTHVDEAEVFGEMGITVFCGCGHTINPKWAANDTRRRQLKTEGEASDGD